MSSSDIFSIGSAGLRTYQSQLSTISQNISNAGSDNYTRRMTVVRESSVSTATSALYKQNATFGGSEAAGVYRVNDPLLDAAVRDSSAALANADSRLRWMSNIEAALNDTSTGVGSALTNFYASVEQLAANPGNAPLRSTMLHQLDLATSAFKSTSASLQNSMESMNTSAESDALLLNSTLEQLQEVNRSILRTQDGTSARAALEDTRDGLVQSISEKLDVAVSIGANGVATLSHNSQTIVSATDVSSFAIAQDADGTLALELDGALVPDPTTGSLAGTIASADIARARLDELDALAVEFATTLNNWHAQGQTDGGVTGGALLNVGTTADSLSVAITNVNDVAAATADGRANGNLLDLATVRQSSKVEDDWTAIVTNQGNLTATAKTKQFQAEEIDSAARVARDAVSGVSLDREAADLLRVQQAYQASAKIVQAARDTIDAILAIN